MTYSYEIGRLVQGTFEALATARIGDGEPTLKLLGDSSDHGALKAAWDDTIARDSLRINASEAGTTKSGEPVIVSVSKTIAKGDPDYAAAVVTALSDGFGYTAVQTELAD